MLKFLLPLIAALKVDIKNCDGGTIGFEVAQAWLSCRQALHQNKALERKPKGDGAVNAAD